MFIDLVDFIFEEPLPMSHTAARRWVAKVAVSAVGAVGLIAAPALADPAPTNKDVVGVGSDAVQYLGDFVADGDYQSNAGYNTAGNVNRLQNFDAVGDANGRAAYLDGSTTSALLPLNPTIVTRAGTSPITRPNGGGAGLTALIADTGAVHKIDFVRNPAPPTSAQETSAEAATNVGQLRTVEVATDVLTVAVSNTSNAPDGLSIPELAKIYKGDYTKWGDLPGYSANHTAAQSAATIIPFVLPSTATTWKNFLADLSTGGAGTFSVPTNNISNPNTAFVEQNDPTVITGPNADNEILPIFKGRLALYAAGYFKAPNANNPLPIGATINPSVKALTGTPPDGGSTYAKTTAYYYIFRQSDAVSTTAWQPGSTLNWAEELFIVNGAKNNTPYFKTSAAAADIASAGATAVYVDKGPGFHS